MKAKITHIQPGIRERFLDDVETRCEKLDIDPAALCAIAGLSYGCWRSWKVDNTAPTTTTMDRVLRKLVELEKAGK